MRKVVLALSMLVSLASAYDSMNVTTCSFGRKQVAAFADIKMVCSGDLKREASTQELYSKGWRLVNSYNFNGEAYLVFERNSLILDTDQLQLPKGK